MPDDGYIVRSLDIADLDGNGSLDLLVTRGRSVTLLRAMDTPLTFGAATLVATGPQDGRPHTTTGDVDGDQRSELIFWDGDAVFVVPAGEQMRPDEPYWRAPRGSVQDVDFSEEDRTMLVTTTFDQYLLDVSSVPLGVQLLMAIDPWADAAALLDLDGHPPMDLVLMTEEGATATFRDGDQSRVGTLVEAPTQVASVRTAWSPRTLVSLTTAEAINGAIMLRASQDVGFDSARLTSWSGANITSFNTMDVDADGRQEIVLNFDGFSALMQVAPSGALRVVGRIGETLRRRPWSVGSRISADLDADGSPEIVLVGPEQDNTLEIYGVVPGAFEATSCELPERAVPLGSRIAPE